MAQDNPLAKISRQAAKFFAEEKQKLTEDKTEFIGQLAIDVLQSGDKVIVKAPIAGVRPDDIEVTVADDMISIKGERREEKKVSEDNYFSRECYWGAFERTFTLPVPVVAEKAVAALKDGVLTITIPKSTRSKSRVIKVRTEAKSK